MSAATTVLGRIGSSSLRSETGASEQAAGEALTTFRSQASHTCAASVLAHEIREARGEGHEAADEEENRPEPPERRKLRLIHLQGTLDGSVTIEFPAQNA